MFDQNRLITLFSLIVLFLSTDIALAVEKTTSSASMSYWPLIALFVLLVIFRKKLFNEATPQDYEPDHDKTPEAKPAAVEKPKAKVETKAKAPTKAKTASKPKSVPKAKAKPSRIDLKDDGNQCQASTAKGSRCKRTTTLEDASVTIDGTTYDLTVCSQHNNDSIKPFADLIK